MWVPTQSERSQRIFTRLFCKQFMQVERTVVTLSLSSSDQHVPLTAAVLSNRPFSNMGQKFSLQLRHCCQIDFFNNTHNPKTNFFMKKIYIQISVSSQHFHRYAFLWIHPLRHVPSTAGKRGGGKKASQQLFKLPGFKNPISEFVSVQLRLTALSQPSFETFA